MSGNSYDSDCYKCGGINTVMCSSESRPFESVSGFCLECGWEYWTEEGQLNEEDLKEFRESFNYEQKKVVE